MPAVAKLVTPGVVNAANAAATDPSKIPHYFGPYSNWANSPQVLANAAVSIVRAQGDTTGAGAEAAATVDPKTGAITGIAVTAAGSGYTAPPSVVIASPGVTPSVLASATATLSSGAISGITVDESGYGFIAPTVTITPAQGNTPSVAAHGVASGGVDDMTIVAGGSLYVNQPFVVFSQPNLPDGVIATGAATMQNGVITAVEVVDPGSGYTSAPTVTIKDGLTFNTDDPAVVTATINVTKVDLSPSGAGYTDPPTVTIMDVLDRQNPANPPTDRFASATATVATAGAVTSVHVDVQGKGYLTPGLKKFVDTLPGTTPETANDLNNYIPTAQPDRDTYPGADYYEIAVVQYRQKFHKDLPPTLLRGYVQLSTSVVLGHEVLLKNEMPDGSQAAILINGQPAYGVDKPSYLGPTIVAEKNRPVRILFRNLLPTGSGGDLFLPVDSTLMGAGMGPNGVTLDANGVPQDMATDSGSVLDGVRNPQCGNTPKPADCYTENRAELHLHGGITPWISDGTPHQWITPAGDSTSYPKGVSVSNVPDMPDFGPGTETFFYTNQQSARMMFYHDHSWGITRLNVYAGEAAGYLVTDATEQSLFGPQGLFPDLGIGQEMVVQDKTFVPADVHATDPTWNSAEWGGEGSLWLPHVYMPAQNPSDATGQNAYGRWMYGSWFWPPATNVKYPPIKNPYYDPTCDPQVADFCEPQMIPGTPNVTVGMEAFNDTPIVNGVAYPTTTVDPKAYRYRILNAANDRFFNLQWYVADPTTGTLSEVALKQSELDAAQLDPNVAPTPDTTKSPAGPSWIQIGTEGGFLPMPTIVPNQPVTWITDPTRFDVGNVDKHSLMLAPAERADVIVDFSQFRGKTLILYNDAPAAYPARVSQYDYYTGNPDLSPVGAPTTLPGYGPNTRTIMQVKVSMKAPAVAFDRPNTTSDRYGTLVNAFKHHLDGNGKPAGVFESGSDPIIVGQAAYNTAYGSNFAASGWCSAPQSPTAKCDGFARIQEQGGNLFKFDTLSGQKLSIPIEPKGMHDEMNSASFDEYGRMTANMGLEAPGATPILQNIILYPYVNPATEILYADNLPSSLNVTKINSSTDGTQIWKITHNGVDTHPIHFHLFDVQLLNRVTWDGINIPPEASELGWKDTIRVSPLEDTIVAVRPIVPTLPFNLPDSKRVPNPMMPEGARGNINGPINGQEAGFNNTAPDGTPMTTPIVNDVVNFGWEYVFHCHILSHEEMDMMRPVIVHVSSTKPDAPGAVTAGRTPDKLAGLVTWSDPTAVSYTDLTTWGSKKNEIGFRIERATVTGSTIGAYSQVLNGTALANATEFVDDTADRYTSYSYRVVAWNEGNTTTSAAAMTPGQPMAPTALAAQVEPRTATPALAQVALSWVNNASFLPGDAIVVERAVGSGSYSTLATLATTASSYVDATTTPGAYHYQVFVSRTGNNSDVAGPVDVSVGNTNLVLTNTPSTVEVGGSVAITATVSSTGGNPATPTGSVRFSINGSNQNVTLNGSGVASFSTTLLPVGSYTITAVYSGDAVFPTATITSNQVVTAHPTTVVAAANPTSLAPGASVSLTATVASVNVPAVPTGQVTFTITNGANPSTVVNANLVNGVATYTTSALVGGSHTVTAVYNGVTNFATSTSSGVVVTVNTLPSTLTLSGTTNPSVFGQTATIKATMNSTAVTGNVTFTVDGTARAPIAISAGVATLTDNTLSVGTHVVSASYPGNGTYNASSSTTNLSQVVNKSNTTTAVTSSKNPATRLTSVTFTATVAASGGGGGVPTGTVQFKSGGVNYGAAVALVAGKATLTTATLAVGTYAITAVYAGTANYNTSTNATALSQRMI
jgi:FtsP/CotA-like multicopper oxidase with cupredoxin domain